MSNTPVDSEMLQLLPIVLRPLPGCSNTCQSDIKSDSRNEPARSRIIHPKHLCTVLRLKLFPFYSTHFAVISQSEPDNQASLRLATWILMTPMALGVLLTDLHSHRACGWLDSSSSGNRYLASNISFRLSQRWESRLSGRSPPHSGGDNADPNLELVPNARIAP